MSEAIHNSLEADSEQPVSAMDRFREMREQAFAMVRGELEGDGEYRLAEAYAILYGSGAVSQTAEIRPAV